MNTLKILFIVRIIVFGCLIEHYYYEANHKTGFQVKLTLIASKTSVASSVASTTVAESVAAPSHLAVIPGPKATRESAEEE